MSGQFYSLAEIATMDRGLFHPQLFPCLSKTADYIRILGLRENSNSGETKTWHVD